MDLKMDEGLKTLLDSGKDKGYLLLNVQLPDSASLARTDHARAQVSTLRLRFLKLAVRIEVSVRRIVLHFPQTYPDRADFQRLALSLGAQSG